MAHDAELDRLKAAQDLAFQRKQDAYSAMDTAWKRRSAARDALDSAHAAKQSAYGTQSAAWQHYQSVRASNGPRIDSLNTQQERAFQDMGRAFDNASAAYSSGNGLMARSYADDGHRYKAESQGCVAERRALVQQIRDARDNHSSTRPAFEQAKSRFDDAKREYDRAREDHQRKQTEFKRAKAEFDAAVTAFQKRLEEVRAAAKQRRQSRRSVAERAGVPYQYLDNVLVSLQGDTYNIYFGGVGKPNGPGHGHYVMDRSGNVTYRRDPFDPHGAHNFTDAQRDYYDIIGTELAHGGEFGFQCKFRGFNALVESGFSSRDGKPKIDIYYGPSGPLGPGHHHAVAFRDSPYIFVYDEYRS